YRVWAAANGIEALALWEKEGADEIALVLCDLIMPEMGGRELMTVLNTKEHNPPCIIITGYPLDDSDAALHLENVVGWLQKPVNLDTLAQTVARQIMSSATT
ncbi:MAG: response regulator, partial [Anaerolineae bacterium]